MSTYTVGSLSELARLIQKHMKAREKRILKATRKTADKGVPIAKQNVPRAFGELEDGIHAAPTDTGAQVISDAPHAAAVEKGSRPHYPPLEPLIAWVRLRALQAFRASSPRAMKTKGYAGVLARQKVSAVRKAVISRMKSGTMQGDEIIEDIARGIQQAIGLRGTKPRAYMLASVPAIESTLATMVQQALPDTASD